MSKLMELIERISISISILCVAAMMLITSYDALARYAFSSPLPWAYDVVAHFLLAASVFFAISATFQAGDHINIDLFRTKIPAGLRSRLDGIWCLMTVVAFGAMAYGSGMEALKFHNRGSFLTGYIPWPAWIPYAIVALGCAIMTLRLAISGIPMLITGRSTLTEHSHEGLE